MRHALHALILSAVIVTGGVRIAEAQNRIRKVDVVVFEPSPSPFGVVTLDSSDTMKNLRWYASFFLTYSRDPLRAVQGGQTVFHYVRNHLSADLMFALGIWKYFEVGAHVPVVFYQDGSDPDPLAGVTSELKTAAIGDVRIVPKARFWQPRKHGFGMALVPQFTAPSGLSRAHAGERSMTFEPKLVIDYQFRQGTLLALNAGVRVRRPLDVGNLRVGHEFFYGVGAEVAVYKKRLSILAEVFGSLGFKDAPADSDSAIDEEEIPLEGLLGVRYRFSKGLIATAGATIGMTNGWGTPIFRVFAGIGVTLGDTVRPSVVPGDPDEDGFVGDADKCPYLPEDKDGNLDHDGCPDPDDDKDGVCDDNEVIQRHLKKFRDVCIGRDRCPTRKEVINGFKDEDGCPDQAEARVFVKGDRIVMLDKIHFDTGRSRIQRKSYPILRTVAALLRTRPSIKRLEVEGHTDERGTSALNMRLSRRRARAVRRFLIRRGISPRRLVARGYGDTRPVAKDCGKKPTPEARKECWAKNRRVDFRKLSP